MGVFRRRRMVARTVTKGPPLNQSTVGGDHVDERLAIGDGTVTFDHANLKRVDLSHQAIQNIVVVGSTFEECNLEGVVIHSGVLSHLPQSVYRNCNFANADLRDVSPLSARFEGCRFSNTLIDDWHAVCAEFVGCQFEGRLVRVKFSARPLGPCAKFLANVRSINQFTGNDFRNTELVDCRISGGIELDDQMWPSGSQYLRLDRLQERIRCAQEKVQKDWPIGLDRDRAITLLDLYSHRDYAVQEGLILRRDDVYSYGPWTERLWSMLQSC
jgi:pentapeptide repeat protein